MATVPVTFRYAGLPSLAPKVDEIDVGADICRQDSSHRFRQRNTLGRHEGKLMSVFKRLIDCNNFEKLFHPDYSALKDGISSQY
jgi:hypothetical protein